MADTETVGPPAPPKTPPKTKTGAPDPGRRMTGFVRVPMDEVTLEEAMGLVDDGSWWVDTMPPILLGYPVQVPSVDVYWGLSVRDHRALYEWLEKSGVVKDGDKPQT